MVGVFGDRKYVCNWLFHKSQFHILLFKDDVILENFQKSYDLVLYIHEKMNVTSKSEINVKLIQFSEVTNAASVKYKYQRFLNSGFQC